MQHLIQLQAGINSLSENEFLNFIKHFGQHNIAILLFKYFHDKLQKMDKCQEINNKLSIVHNMNELIAEIIRARDKASSEDNNIDDIDKNKMDKICKAEPIKLDQLPVVMISHISSFFDFNNMLNFEKCNRSIFIATRSPSTVNELNDYYFNKFWVFSIEHQSIYNFHRFTSLKKLHLKIHASHCYLQRKYGIPALNNILISNKLKHLKLTSSPYIVPPSILNELSLCNLSNVSHFHYNGPINDVLSILNKLQNLQYLILYQSEEECVDLQKLALVLSKASKLNGLQIVSDDEQEFEPLLNDIDVILQSLHWNTYNFNVKNNFMNLQEICLDSPSKTNIDILVNQKLPFLKRICFSTSRYDYGDITEEHKQSIESLFSLKSLTFIDIESYDDGSDTFEIMVKILQKSLNCNQYKTMKINMVCWNRICVVNEDDNDIGNDLFLLLNILRKKCSNFIFRCHLKINEENHAINKLLKNVKNASNDFKIEYEKQEIAGNDDIRHEFMIMNKDCSMNACEAEAKWIMPCTACY